MKPKKLTSVDQLAAHARKIIIGQLRLRRIELDEIADFCATVLENSQYPKKDLRGLDGIVYREHMRAEQEHSQAQMNWPLVTDCDRLDAIEEHFRLGGILFWQASPHCPQCTVEELEERFEELKQRRLDVTSNLRGLCFFCDDDLADSLASGTEVLLPICYGLVYLGDVALGHAALKINTLNLGREICRTFSEFGFEPDWSGNLGEPVVIRVNWQRRDTLL